VYSNPQLFRSAFAVILERLRSDYEMVPQRFCSTKEKNDLKNDNKKEQFVQPQID
jgi:hypothetical protein